MVLQCECGGALEITSQHYPEDEEGNNTGMAHESYECVSCGRVGGFRFGKGREETSGCVTTSFESTTGQL